MAYTLVVIGLLPALVSAALANGQTTHVWITRAAINELSSSSLQDLVSDPAYEPMLIHGTMFPDGGYPLDHSYGEAAHWEPFQMAYLEWIQARYSEPWSAEAKSHIAFWLGMASHGMADQVFDAFYLDRSRHEDADHGWANGESLDEATDVIWASMKGAETVPERWVPDSVFVALYDEQSIQVETDTLHDGQTLLEAAIDLVGWMAQNTEAVEAYRNAFPWGGNHLDDETLPGVPKYEAQVIAEYWQTLWDRLHGNPVIQEVLATHPVDEGTGHPIAVDEPESRITIVFGQRLLKENVESLHFKVEAGIGRPVGFEPWLYYGDHSHIVHLIPNFDLPENRTILVTVSDELSSAEGAKLSEPYFFSFETGGPQVEQETGCQCSSAGRLSATVPLALLSCLFFLRRRASA